jgi:hypothetical protein
LAVGGVYSGARIQLSEQERERSGLRVPWFPGSRLPRSPAFRSSNSRHWFSSLSRSARFSAISSPAEQHARLGHGDRLFVRSALDERTGALLAPLGALFQQGGDWAV